MFSEVFVHSIFIISINTVYILNYISVSLLPHFCLPQVKYGLYPDKGPHKGVYMGSVKCQTLSWLSLDF